MKYNIDITENEKQHPFLTIIVSSSKNAIPYIGISPYDSNGKLTKSQIILSKNQLEILKNTLNAVYELI